MADFVDNLAVESWTLYAVGMVLIACRLISRGMKLGGWTKLQIEDYLMCIVACTFTADIWAVNEVAKNGSNYMTPEVEASLTPKQVEMAIYGSKMTLALEMFTLTTVWLIKACLLILYYRLTLAFDKEFLAVKLIALFCVVGYILVTLLCLTYWCQPIQEYWRVPVKYSQCATYYNHMIFATAFNISSDLMLLAIPIPIIIRSQLPRKRKIVLCLLLGLGALNILAALLNRYFNFTNPNDLRYVYWYVGEVATAVYVGNIPLCWHLLHRVFHLDTWSRLVGEQSPNQANSSMGPKPKRFPGGRSLWDTKNDTVWDRTTRRSSRGGDIETSSTGNASEERIWDGKGTLPGTDGRGDAMELTPTWQSTANWTHIDAGPHGEAAKDAGIVDDIKSGIHVVQTTSISHETCPN